MPLMAMLETAPGFIRRYSFPDGPNITLLALWRTAADARAFAATPEHRAAVRDLVAHRWQYSHFSALWEVTSNHGRQVFCPDCDAVTPAAEGAAGAAAPRTSRRSPPPPDHERSRSLVGRAGTLGVDGHLHQLAGGAGDAARGARLVADLVECDLTSGATFAPAVPHEAFDVLTGHGGIAWHDEPPVEGMLGDNPLLQFVDSPGFWVATSHALVSEVDRDQERFSSEMGGTFMPSLTEDSLAVFRQMMLNMDHPQHSRLRRILQPIFTPRSIERLRASIEGNAARHPRRGDRRVRPGRPPSRPRCRCGCWPTCSACPATTAT